jgi:hypothetical protein
MPIKVLHRAEILAVSRLTYRAIPRSRPEDLTEMRAQLKNKAAKNVHRSIFTLALHARTPVNA